MQGGEKGRKLGHELELHRFGTFFDSFNNSESLLLLRIVFQLFFYGHSEAISRFEPVKRAFATDTTLEGNLLRSP